MAKRRNLKKSVNYIIGELFAECSFIARYVPGVDKTKADAIMLKLLNVQEDFISRISHAGPNNAKLFYKKFRTGFQEQVNAIIEEIQQLH